MPALNKIDQKTREVFRQQILPLIEREVNEGACFAPLRQMFYCLILANYFKDVVKTHPVYGAYIDQRKTGVLALPHSTQVKEKIYGAYVESFKNTRYTRKESNGTTTVIRRYTTGGLQMNELHTPRVVEGTSLSRTMQGHQKVVLGNIHPQTAQQNNPPVYNAPKPPHRFP